MFNLVFVTKPVQYVNARNLIETICVDNTILVVIDHFCGAKEFYERI